MFLVLITGIRTCGGGGRGEGRGRIIKWELEIGLALQIFRDGKFEFRMHHVLKPLTINPLFGHPKMLHFYLNPTNFLNIAYYVLSTNIGNSVPICIRTV